MASSGKQPSASPKSGGGAKTPAPATGDVPRRGFMVKAAAVVCGGITALVPLAAGVLMFLDPLRARKSRSHGAGGDGATAKLTAEGFYQVTGLDSLVVGEPKRFAIIADRLDAWNLFENEPVGAVYLVRQSDDSVIALNVSCPHAGCPVDFDGARQVYQCPCHDSSFKIDGELANLKSPAARGLDTLDVEVVDASQVWVKYQRFQAGTHEKIVEA